MNNFLISIKLQMFLRRLKQIFSHPVKGAGFILFILGSLLGMFFFLYKGMFFLNSLGSLGTVIFDKLFYLFFFSLFWLLVASSGLLFYFCVFGVRETHFLVTLPVKNEDMLYNKFMEASFLSSWAFVFVIVPFIYAYGFIAKLPFVYYLGPVLFLIPFIVIATCLGTILCIILLFFLRYRITKYVLAVLFIVGTIFVFKKSGGPAVFDEAIFLSRINPVLQVSFYPFSVNFWTAEGLRALERGSFSDVMLYFSCLWSTFFVLYMFFQKLAGKLFYSCYQWVYFFSKVKRTVEWKIDDIVYKLKPRWLWAFMLKDVKIFLRDPLAWSQFFFFFGILLIYALNLKNFSYNDLVPMWKNIIVFLNTFAACIVLSSLGTRYVYPQLSLEGLNFWILNTSGVSLRKILFEKFIISFIPSLVLCESIILATCLNLGVSRFMMFASASLVFIMAVGVISICLGMGCIFADFSKKHHLEVISEFGGIITLMVTLLYIALSTFLLASLFHLYTTGKVSWNINTWTCYYLVALFMITVIASIVFLEAGRVALSKKEF